MDVARLEAAASCRLPSLGALGRSPGVCRCQNGVEPRGNWGSFAGQRKDDSFHGVVIHASMTVMVFISGSTPVVVRGSTGRRSFATDSSSMPAGGGPKRERPVASMIAINRARSHPRAVSPAQLQDRRLPATRRLRVVGFRTGRRDDRIRTWPATPNRHLLRSHRS